MFPSLPTSATSVSELEVTNYIVLHHLGVSCPCIPPIQQYTPVLSCSAHPLLVYHSCTHSPCVTTVQPLFILIFFIYFNFLFISWLPYLSTLTLSVPACFCHTIVEMRLSVRLDLEMSRSNASLASSHTHVDRLEHPPRQGNDSTLDVEKHARSEDDQQKGAPDAPSTDEELPKSGPSGPPGPGGPGVNELYKPKTLKFWLILLSNFLAMFLVALDRTIVATAIPTITDEFHSLGDIGWYGSAYMLTTSAAQLVFGRLYKYYSMKWQAIYLGDFIGNI